MPKIYRANDFIVSDEVFTISEDEFFEEDPIYGQLSDEEDGEEHGSRIKRSAEEEEREREWERREQETQEQAAILLEQANAEAQRMLAEAQTLIAAQREQARAEAEQEAEQFRKQGYEEGFAAGKLDGARQEIEEIKQCIASLENGVGKIEGDRAGFIAEYEYNLKWLAWEIASKVLGRKIERDETEMLSLVKAAAASVKNAEWITIEISEKMTGLIDLLERELRKAGDERVEVRGVSAPEGTCVIDTPSGLVDASVYTQLENLRVYFAQEDDA